MAKSYTLVALPEMESRVWKLSSEKVPHLTILFLGENLENANRALSFIKHVSDVTLSPFYLDVDRRGVLGEKNADVLFLKNSNVNRVADFRRYLLNDPDIKAAYESVDQYPQWTPHLTMGYPETPAKQDDLDYGIHSVLFDRIALWEDDYEGAEFPLTQIDTETELAMAERGRNFLEHYGVKGMKWGVIRDAGKGVAKELYSPSKDYKDAQRAQIKAKFGGTRAMTNAEMRQVIARMSLDKQYRDLYGEHQLHDAGVSAAKRYSKRGARWAGRFLSDVLKDGAASWIRRPDRGTSPSYSWGNPQIRQALDGKPLEINS